MHTASLPPLAPLCPPLPLLPPSLTPPFSLPPLQTLCTAPPLNPSATHVSWQHGTQQLHGAGGLCLDAHSPSQRHLKITMIRYMSKQSSIEVLCEEKSGTWHRWMLHHRRKRISFSAEVPRHSPPLISTTAQISLSPGTGIYNRTDGLRQFFDRLCIYKTVGLIPIRNGMAQAGVKWGRRFCVHVEEPFLSAPHSHLLVT